MRERQRRPRDEQIADIQHRLQIADSLAPLLDGDVTKFFDEIDGSIVAGIADAAPKDAALTHVLALRLAAWREVRAFIHGAASSKTREAFLGRLDKLINPDHQDT